MTKKVGKKSRNFGYIFIFLTLIRVMILQVCIIIWEDATDIDTIEYTAIIQSIERGPTLVYTNKHKAPIGFCTDTILNTKTIQTLLIRDQITYCVKKNEIKYLNDPNEIMGVVFCKIETTVIVNFELFNAFTKERRIEIWLLLGIISGGVLICSFAFITYSIQKKKAVLKDLTRIDEKIVQ